MGLIPVDPILPEDARQNPFLGEKRKVKKKRNSEKRFSSNTQLMGHLGHKIFRTAVS